MVRITTWNVNGIRNPFGYQPWRETRTFDAMFDILEADVVIMQELKIQRKDLTDDMVLVPGWDCYFSLPKHKKGNFVCRAALRDKPGADMRPQDIRALAFIHANQPAPPYVLKRVSWACFPRQAPQLHTETCQTTLALAVILRPPKWLPWALTQPRSTLRAAVSCSSFPPLCSLVSTVRPTAMA